MLNIAEKNPKVGVRRLAELFDCSKTQISSILKNKDTILELYEANMSNESLKSRKRCQPSDYVDINEALYKWYTLACSHNIYPGGSQLREKAKQISEQLHVGESNFKASNGWLDRWKKRYNVRQVTVSGESGDVSGQTVDSWKERLPELLQGYKSVDVWNLDETSCFWSALPDRGFAQKGSQCKGGKKAKQRITVALIANACGGREKAIVIWKSEKPRYFKGIDVNQLPVKYFSQSKAWMTGDILDTILSKINRQLSTKNRFILLLMDNAGCHPHNLKQHQNIVPAT